LPDVASAASRTISSDEARLTGCGSITRWLRSMDHGPLAQEGSTPTGTWVQPSGHVCRFTEYQKRSLWVSILLNR